MTTPNETETCPDCGKPWRLCRCGEDADAAGDAILDRLEQSYGEIDA